MSALPGHFKQVLRGFSRAPGFTVIAVATLAIGIGANSAIFSVINGVLLKPLPYPDPDRLVGVWETAPGFGMKDINASPSTYFTFRSENHVFEDIGMWQRDSVSVTGLAEPEQVDALNVTDGVLPILGVQAAVGRRFSKKDDLPGNPQTAILSYAYWQRRFAGNPSVIGRRLIVEGRAREIIGVLPANFRFLDQNPALLIPLQLNEKEAFVGNFSFESAARLKPGVSLAQANSDIARMLPIMMRRFPPAPGISLQMLEAAKIGPNLRPLKRDVIGDVGNTLWVLMATVGIVLFIACANVANLVLVRAEGRQQELAVRTALGANWLQIAAHLLIESLTLALSGGLLGVALAYGALRILVALAPANLPRLAEIALDGHVLIFSAAISVFAGIFFGLVPTLKHAAPQLATTLREGGRTLSDSRQRHRTRAVLVIAQVALALVLLISSGLMIRTMNALRHVDPGFVRPGQVQTFRISIPDAQIPDPLKVVRAYEDIVQKLSAVPGVSAVSFANSMTMDGQSDNDPIFAEDKSYAEGKLPPLRRFKFVSPGSFATMGNPLLAGRDLTWADFYNQRSVVLVSENLAREAWGAPASAIGKRVHENLKAPWREIIGVVGNERDNGVNQPAPTIVYWPIIIKEFWGQPLIVQRSMAFAVRSTRTGSVSFMNELRRAVWSVNPNLPIANVRTLKDIHARSMARSSFTLVMLAVAGAMALLLGLVGIYGVISYSVAQRTREIGIRMALGAQHAVVRQMFVRHGVTLTVAGIVVGLAAAAVLTRLMQALLFEVSPLDPVTYCAVPLVLVAAAFFASYLPARRATLVDPVQALRVE